jgi:catechol 2,3-dioxygenase-like lactoylglutathione lyase family enzyme
MARPSNLIIGSIVIRVQNLERQSRFWCSALDLVERSDQSTDFKLLKPRSGIGPNVSLDLHKSEQPIPPRLHLDLYTESQEIEVARLEVLGAKRIYWEKQPKDSDFVIMEDPEGNRFCVVQK